jgi:4-hydroxythreonine-4-phosphate dehydrogenase
MNAGSENVRVGISTGDLNGIGLEVIIKTLEDARILSNCTPVIYGSSKVVSFYKNAQNAIDFNATKLRLDEALAPFKINLKSVWEEDVKIEPGQSSNEAASYGFRSFEAAAADLKNGLIDVLVTGPVNKQTVAQSGVEFIGHTEYLAKQYGIENYLMLLVSDNLRVGVVTGHVPIQKVASLLTTEKIIEKARVMHFSLKQDFGISKPKIAILGLNPHAGDDGLIGSEEKDIIAPAIQALNKEGIMAFGPYSADGFFGSAAYSKFDAILAMYHDQGLVPFKSLAFSSGVNFTAGLPVVRTSPDHGPAFDIAGKNEASESSFREAFFLAQDIFIKRKEYKELTANPLPLGFSKLTGDY